MARPCGGLRSASVSKYLNWINMLQSLLDPYCVSPVFHELHGMCLNSPLFRICYTGGMQTVNQVKSSCLLSPMSFAQVLQNKILTVFHQHKYSTQNWPNVTTVEVRIYEPLYASRCLVFQTCRQRSITQSKVLLAGGAIGRITPKHKLFFGALQFSSINLW